MPFVMSSQSVATDQRRLGRMQLLLVFGSFVLFFFWPVPSAMAHHGKEFVATATGELPERGTLWFLTTGDFRAAEQLNDTDSDFELSPGLLYGFTSWGAAELHPHIGKERGHGLSYEATGLELRLNPPSRPGIPIRVGFAMEYEIAARAAARNAFDVRLILSHERGRLNTTGNIGWQKDSKSGKNVVVTLLGARYAVNGTHSVALEVLAFSGDGIAFDVVPSWTIQLGRNQTVRVGSGVSLNHHRSFLSLRTVYVFGL